MKTVYDKWKSLGFLDGELLVKQKIRLSNAMEYSAMVLLDEYEQKINDYNPEVIGTLIFPILRRIMVLNPTNELNYGFIDSVLKKVSEFTKTELFKGLDDLTCCGCCDMETELLNLFVETNYGQ
jgi:hypothetical protein